MRTATAIASAILLASGMLIGCTTAVTQGTIEGTVFDGAQEPVVGAWVTVSSEGTQYARVPSNSNGKYKVTNIPPGTYDVAAAPPAALSTELGSDGPYPVKVQGGGTVVRNFFLPPAGGTLTGVVRLPSSTPAQAAVVRVTQGTNLVATDTTNLAGEYAITDLEPGVYSVKATLVNFGDSVEHSVTITSGQTTTLDLDLTIL